MAKDEATRDSATAVMERPLAQTGEHDDKPESSGMHTGAAIAQKSAKQSKADKKNEHKAKKNDKKKKGEEDEPEYEVEFQTPFGKLEFEFEPLTSKHKRDKKRAEQAERDTKKKAAEAAKKAEARVMKQASSGGGGKLLLVILVIGAVMALIALAIWLFARPGIDDEAVPPEFRTDGVADPAMAEPQGFAGRARARIRSAVRAGRHASREAQQEQEQRFENMTQGR